MDELVPPVVTEKPARGREMQTTAIPIDVFDSMRLVSAKKTLQDEDLATELEKPREAAAEYFHEGYVDGKKYLVPDSNLEAMKDIINFKMRPRRSTRYKHQTSYEISDYDHFRGKLDGILNKIDNLDFNISPSASESSEAEKQNVTQEDKPTGISSEKIEPIIERDSTQNKSNESILTESPSTLSQSTVESSTVSKLLSAENLSSLEHGPDNLDVQYFRFLISGHFKKDQKPIYIVQEYDGQSDLFKNQKVDFISNKKDGNVNVFVSGKFYKENILQELDGNPVALKTKQEEIKIVKEKSKIYPHYFQDVYKMKDVDITLKGEFLNNKITNKITPFLTLGVKKKANNDKPYSTFMNSDSKLAKNIYSTQTASPTTVLLYKPMYSNPFSGDAEYVRYEDEYQSSIGGHQEELSSQSNSNQPNRNFELSLYSSNFENNGINDTDIHKLYNSLYQLSPAPTMPHGSTPKEGFFQLIKKKIVCKMFFGKRKDGFPKIQNVNKECAKE